MRRTALLSLLLALLLPVSFTAVGCNSRKTSSEPDPDVAAVIPITSSMSPEEVLLVKELNQCREIKWPASKEARGQLVIAYAILKARHPVVVMPPKKVEDD